MSSFFQKLVITFTDAKLRNRILFVLFALVLFRALAAIPVPGVDAGRLAAFFEGNQFVGLLNIFSGGGLANLSIVMLGLGPYITAAIIMQLTTMMSKRLKELYHESGEVGRRKFSQYTRLLTVPLAAIQGWGLLTLLEGQGILTSLTLIDRIENVIIITAGSMLLMWIGELVSEFGIGNGVSLLIFAGIVAALPGTVSQLLFAFDVSQLPLYFGFLLAAIFIVAGVVLATEAERPVPVTYAKRVRGMKVYGGAATYLPLRVNQAGVIPIIFALSMLLVPQLLFSAMAGADNVTIASIGGVLNAVFSNGWFYSIFYFVLVFLFTFFYTAVTFDPQSIASNLQKNGAFVPGVRPGQSTADYLGRILTRITFVGAVFLGLIAVLPLAMRAITGVTALAIGGTALLIVVSVVLDFVKKVDAQISMREY